MNAFLCCSIEKYNQYKKEYNIIRRFLLSNGHMLTFDWVNSIEKLIPSERASKMSRLLSESLEGIKKADLVIIEGTVPSFETGFLAHYSIENKKPTLFLTLDQGENTQLNDLITIEGNDYYEDYYYSLTDFEQIVTNFIQRHQGGLTSRFNIILGRKQKNYLDWADRFYKQSKSEIIRDLIDKKASEDLHYQRSGVNVT